MPPVKAMSLHTRELKIYKGAEQTQEEEEPFLPQLLSPLGDEIRILLRTLTYDLWAPFLQWHLSENEPYALTFFPTSFFPTNLAFTWWDSTHLAARHLKPSMARHRISYIRSTSPLQSLHFSCALNTSLAGFLRGPVIEVPLQTPHVLQCEPWANTSYLSRGKMITSSGEKQKSSQKLQSKDQMPKIESLWITQLITYWMFKLVGVFCVWFSNFSFYNCFCAKLKSSVSESASKTDVKISFFLHSHSSLYGLLACVSNKKLEK